MNALEKRHQQACSTKCCHKPSNDKKMQYLLSAIKQSAMKQDMPVWLIKWEINMGNTDWGQR